MRPIWPKLQQMNLNTVIAPVYWELMEPIEGKFDFTLVDSLIKNARLFNMKLVILWFGAWKNSMSCYAPAWVKTNTTRFPRILDKPAARMK
jgi:beta-galactosidase GanA